ncbi:MAG: 50S ribosomal protein L29 [Cyanobacteria bacterium SBLK]|nr:50S ribosomal protein L29 [Cyanobacteria bacterium SBLK]
MALSKVEDARALTDEALAEEILTAKRKLFQLRLERATGRLEKTHEFKHTKRWIAQLLTIERERELNEGKNSGVEEAPPAAKTEPAETEESVTEEE